MRSTTSAILAVAIGVSTLAGCGAARRDSSEAHWWRWETSKDQPRPNLSQQYGIAEKPERSALLDSKSFNLNHPEVSDYVARYQTELRGFYGRALERSGLYVPRIEPILEKEGIPPAFAYLPLIESGFRTQAVSPARAVGLWQFIPDTGRRYGLRIDGFVDERRDPVKSTHAAARYLKDLYSMFGDWHLSLAAYNTGEGRISRILNTSEADDFWEMSERGYLFRETRNYVPGFLAALRIAAAPEVYGFNPSNREPEEYEVVHVNQLCPLSKVAEWCGTSTDTIKELNPALHRGLVPPTGYHVRVPKGTKSAFESVYARLSAKELAAIERSALPPVVARKRCTRRAGRTVCSPANKTVVANRAAGSNKTVVTNKSRSTAKTQGNKAVRNKGKVQVVQANSKIRTASTSRKATQVASNSKRTRRAVD